MKKLLLLGAAGIAVLGVTAGPASAWLDWLWGHHCCVTVKYSYRPYNAFDPGPWCGMMGGGNGCGAGASCANGACINSGFDAGSLPAPATAPATKPAPGGAATTSIPSGPTAPVFMPPMPGTMPATSQMWYNPAPAAPTPVRAAGYAPNYYPGYYPGYNPGSYPTSPMGYGPGQPAVPMAAYPYGVPGYGR